ncbi:T6SS immunity protein Tdi1 domain-containing protein [Volucribacter amazonae]|uniref:Glutamyl-tRNA amidotransferase n=1 Tax=Volucribacter amazonae TaxID=256731 RepID=A0A9X4P7S0_9PAST|nr:T6SS immunity protein Tdi1 domain-containing protein [Volucribacter amazonae]MDG6894093.1 glutamyl-tRNA amidotransferase [Volucribacter amazonae]
METIKNFIERNKNSYIKHSLADKATIEKYRNMYQGNSYFPEELLWIWENMGFGVYEDGFLQIVNPDEYDFVFDYVDKMLEPTVVWGITALGDILVWEGNDNWRIAPDEGNRDVIINLRTLDDDSITRSFSDDIDFVLSEEGMIAKYYKASLYFKIKDKFPKLKYGQCYGYVPALCLGGSKAFKNIKIVDAKAYIMLIGEAVGKIIDLYD